MLGNRYGWVWKGKERKGKERKGKERKGKERKGKEWKGKGKEGEKKGRKDTNELLVPTRGWKRRPTP
jgi:hypothetical protein